MLLLRLTETMASLEESVSAVFKCRSCKTSEALFICQDCPSPSRLWCGACKGGHDLLTHDHRIIPVLEYEADHTKYPLCGNDSCEIPARGGQKFMLVCTPCGKLLCATCAHGKCSKSRGGTHKCTPLADVTKEQKERLSVAVQNVEVKNETTSAALTALKRQKQKLITTIVYFTSAANRFASSLLDAYSDEVERRIENAESSTDNRRNVRVEAEGLLDCPNDIEVYKKMPAVISCLEEQPVEPLRVLPALEFVQSTPVSGSVRWIPPIIHRNRPRLPGGEIPSGWSSLHSNGVYYQFEVGLRGLYVTKDEGERVKVVGGSFSSVCTSTNGAAVYTVSSSEVTKYSVGQAGEIQMVKRFSLSFSSLFHSFSSVFRSPSGSPFGISVISSNGNVVTVSQDNIRVLSSDLQILTTLTAARLFTPTAQPVLVAVKCSRCHTSLCRNTSVIQVRFTSMACDRNGSNQVFVAYELFYGKSTVGVSNVTLVDLDNESVMWRHEMKGAVLYAGDVVYCTDTKKKKLILLRPADGAVLGEVDYPRQIVAVSDAGRPELVEVICYK